MPKKFSLAAFSVGKKLDPANLPDRLLVVPWGETRTRKGLVVCNATTLATLPGRQAAEKFDRVAFDFQHNTVKPGPEPKKVAGYGIPEVVAGEGVYLSSIEYTDEGREALAGGHYPDISPAVVRNERGEVVFLHSVGACRQGEIDGLTLFSAADELRLSAFEAIDDPDDLTEDRADLRGALVALLGAISPETPLAADADDGAVAAAALAAAKKLQGGTTPADASPAELAAKVDAMEARLAAGERRAILDRAAREGKVVPLSADEVGKLELTVLESLVANLPATVPVESRLGGAIDDFQATPGKSVTPELREVARQMGMKPEDLV